MKLDVLIATCERPLLLSRTLDSLLSAPVPVGLDVHVTVVQNDAYCTTREVIERFKDGFGGRLHHLHVPTRGKSHALNAAIHATSGDLVAFIDDDEEIDADWYSQIVGTFGDEEVDFIGGPCLPRWGTVPPEWMPRSYRGVIGHVDDGERVMVFGKDAPGILVGGNAVVRRRVITRAGDFLPSLGPRPELRLLSGEDEEFYARLLEIGANGLYIPGLKIHHYVPAERLTKKYYRRWCFWNGVSRSVIDHQRPSHVVRVGKVPRYLYGSAVRGLMQVVRSFHAPLDPSSRFEAELAIWHLLGFVYGSYLYRGGSRAADRPVTVIRPPALTLSAIARRLALLPRHGHLLAALTAHRIKVRYKQSVLGPAWALLQPLAMMAIFALVFSMIVRIPSNRHPYALFAYAGLLPWTAFASALGSAAVSLVSHGALVTRVYFPREILPLTYVLTALFDLVVASTLLGAMLVWYDVAISLAVLWVVPMLVLLGALALAISLILCAVNVRFRDVGVAMPLALQLGMFASPVIYPREAVPARIRDWYDLNPMVGIIDGFRRAVLDGLPPDPAPTIASVAVVAVLLPAAYLWFTRVEATMADYI